VGQTTQLWYAYDEPNRNFVGVKMLLPKFARDRTQMASLKWELKISQDVDDERIIKIHEYGYEEKTSFLVMEWFPAPNMKMILNKGYAIYASHLPTILPLMTEGLAALHQKKWVHRDVKPDNFLYDPDERTLKVIDFGIAQKVPSGLSKIFFVRKRAQGTASYMSGEQILGKPTDERSDVYSLGCTFFELLTGKLPYTGNSLNELLQKHISGGVPPVSVRNRNLTPEMINLLTAMMAKKADDRPKSCVELLDYIKKIRIFRRNPSGEDLA